MTRSCQQPDVLVLGTHPCAYLAAALLRQNSAVGVTLAAVPGERLDAERLVLINPEFFELHPIVAALRRSIHFTALHGIRFLADDPSTHSEYASKGVAAYVASLGAVRDALAKTAAACGVEIVGAAATPRDRHHDDREDQPAGHHRGEAHRSEAHRAEAHPDDDANLSIGALDETGVEVALNGTSRKAKLLIVAADLPPDARRVLGLPESWESGVLHRYSYLLLNKPAGFDAGNQLLPMSLDLKGQLTWAWLLPGEQTVQLAVEQPVDQARAATGSSSARTTGSTAASATAPAPATSSASSSASGVDLMRHWVDVLRRHGVLRAGDVQSLDSTTSIDLPFAGALSQEGVANRALLIGPAGGFYSACAEDLYPACWSAIFAADAARRALKEKHLQDALQPYRHKWGSTLGDYLRGPQQNLRFLLPLVYRNKMMTARLAEAILFGKSVVR